jgi:FkbM family methyltransferase
VKTLEPLYNLMQAAYAVLCREHDPPSMTPAEYRGLLGEVIGYDCYRIAELDFVPNVIFDIGANVGVFTMFARALYPSAKIVAVEPDRVNFANLMHLTKNLPNIVYVNRALGSGQVWHKPDPVNGSKSSYLCETLGFSAEEFRNSGYVPSDVVAVTLRALWNEHCGVGKSCFWKIDCEGMENSFWGSIGEMAVLAGARAASIEMHSYSNCDREEMLWKRNQSLGGLEPHTIEWDEKQHICHIRLR